ncbi:MAG: FkbM family methyltransferase [Flavobacteriaceae bacterium]
MKVRKHKKVSRLVRGYFKNKILSNYGKGILADTKNGLFIVDPKDFTITRKLLKNGTYDWEEIRCLRKYLNKESIVIFVGCHIGTLLIPIAKSVKKVYGFEANPKNFELLNYNLLLNKTNNTDIKNIAIGEEERKVNINHNDINTGNSSIALSIKKDESLIDMKRLDDLVSEENIDMIIMDIEGYEINAIRGAFKTLKKTKYFYVEYAPEQLSEFGMSSTDFINSISDIYRNMYLIGKDNKTTKFENSSWINHLKELPQRRGLLLNLLFTNNHI